MAEKSKKAKKKTADSNGEDDRSHSEGVSGLIDDLASNIPLGDTLAKIVGSSERLTQAQAAAYSAVGLSSAQDIERLALRVRSLFHRIDELEDELDEAGRRISALERELQRAKPKSGSGK